MRHDFNVRYLKSLAGQGIERQETGGQCGCSMDRVGETFLEASCLPLSRKESKTGSWPGLIVPVELDPEPEDGATCTAATGAGTACAGTSCTPCNACPTGALRFRDGRLTIAPQLCISCGKCIGTYKAGGKIWKIIDRSWLFTVARLLIPDGKPRRKTLALIAPAALSCFDANLEQALLKTGFCAVESVLQGALEVIKLESRALETSKSWMCTSCCGAILNLESRILPFLAQKRMNMPTPLALAARMCREKYPDHCIVFISPCIAKKTEVMESEFLDAMLTFEELSCLFEAFGVDCRQKPARDDTGYSGGISGAVIGASSRKDARQLCIKGLTRKSLGDIARWKDIAPNADLVEILACPGGCTTGPGMIVQ